MSNELMIFNNEEFGEIRVISKDSEAWLCLKDVCSILGIKNVSDCKSRLNQKGVVITDTLTTGGTQKLTYINESNFYKVIFQSRKEEAEKFQDWVTSEVLPSIRKHGAYMTNEVIEKTLTDPDFLIQLATQLKEEKQARKELEEKNRILVKENNKLETEVEYKEDVIIGLVKDVSLAEKRQRITQIVRHGTKKYAERYAYLYDEFDRKFHVDTKRRLDNAIRKGEVKKSVNRMAYICIHMGMTNELYEIACKIFENSVEQLKKEMWDTIAN